MSALAGPRLVPGKVALITGAAGGFGNGLAAAMAEHGADLALLDIEPEELALLAAECRKLGAKAVAITADLRDENAVRNSVRRVVEQFGRLDILVNNAAVLREHPIEAMARDDWEASFAVNLRAPYVLCQEAAAAMERAGGGAIVNITSVAAHTAAPNRSIYSMTKAALLSMTEQIAVESGPRNIRCNAVYFGGIGWSMRGFDPVDPARVPTKGLPMRRLGRKREFANAVVFLASDLASYINGIELPVDGGRRLTLLAGRPTSTQRAMPAGTAP